MIPFHWMILLMVFGFLVFAIVILWNKVQALEKKTELSSYRTGSKLMRATIERLLNSKIEKTR